VKVVLQDGIKDCGVCCLLSIIRFYGGEVSKEYLREITHTTKDGVSLYNLIEGAKQIGFEAIGMSGELENIDVNNLPCVVHFIVNKSYHHFVVLYQIIKKKKQVVLMDPAKGKKVISFSEFHLLSSSAYLFLKPIKKLPIMKKKKIVYRNILKLTHQNKLLLFSITTLTCSFFILNIASTFHFKSILEYSINYNITNNLYWISFMMATIYGLKNCNSLLRNILLQKWISIFDYETTSTTYKQVLLLPYLYYKNRTTGEVVSRFKDMNTVCSFLSNLFCTSTTDLISMILFLFIMFRYQKKITIIIIIISIIFFILTILTTPNKKRMRRKISKNQDIIHSYLINGISNVDTMKGSHFEKRMIDKFKIEYSSFLEKVYDYSKFHEIYYFIKNNMEDCLKIILYGFGSYLIIKEKISLSSFLLYQTFFSYYHSSFTRFLSLLEEYSSYKVALDRVEELFMIPIDNYENNFFYLPYNLEGDIIFKNLNYKIGSKELFSNLNLTIKRGEKLLLSGASGSGKSTLLKMLLRYVETDTSTIFINNIDINHYHLENIRSNITYVTSNEYLFTDTLRNNISMYKEVTEEELHKVCSICCVDEIIKSNLLEYDTLIEENGFNFSNGEKQRIILARSLLRNSAIYIFDEAFSGIDITREKIILEEIFKYLKDKTVIVISHRFNNKKVFDRVLKLERGKIIETA